MANIKYTKEYLIEILQDKAKELGDTPTIHDMSKVIPNARNNYLFYFSSWDDAIKSANLPKKEKVRHPKKTFTKEELISILQSKAKELNKTPSALDLQNIISNTWNTFAKHFGSFNNAVIEAGLKPTIEYNKYTKKELIQILKDKYIELNKIPTSDDMINPDRNWFIYRFGSWNNALIEAELKPKQTRIPKRNKSDAFKNYDIDELITFLKNWADKNDKTLNIKSFFMNDNLPSPSFILNKLELKSWLDVKYLVLGIKKRCSTKTNGFSKVESHKKRTKLKWDSQIGSFNNFDKEEYLNKLQSKKNKHYNGYGHLSRKALLIMMEKEFIKRETTDRNTLDTFCIKDFPKSSYIEKRFKLKWDEILQIYFNDDGILKEE